MMTKQRSLASYKWVAKALRLVALSSVTLFPATVLLELALRVIDPIGIAYFFEANKYFAAMQKNDAYAYIHTPGYAQLLQGVKVTINSHGLRGPEFAVDKPEGTTRILILGDSVVFGWGAPQERIFPIFLQRTFDGWPQPIEVIPAGVGSWNTRTEYEYLKNVGLQFQPDILALVIVANDMEPKSTGHTEVSKELLLNGSPQSKAREHVLQRTMSRGWHFAVAHSYACQYLQYYAKLKTIRAEQAAATPRSTHWQDAKLALDGIATVCREKNIDLVVFLYGTSETCTTSPVLRLYLEHLDKMAVPSYPLLTAEFSKHHRNSQVDGHANADGHELLGKVMYQYLEPIVRGCHLRLMRAVRICQALCVKRREGTSWPLEL